ncbi:GMP synthase (glutamine-hydrolysing) [Acidovorax sp. 94]|uniref:glutamine amidotransferase n=1 Tax=Acidovorax sp. 94 TaxID=2135633 RepID=UPI000EB0D904|nr:glutamine amidotransferase [Acidovorax sp. 94]RKR67026.1 GMP synthase (glutamine-hydrolysing) [Acidovorax sp. 94]
MTATPSRTLWIIKTGDTLPAQRARYGDFEDWIAGGLNQAPASTQLALQTLDARTATAWPEPGQIAGVVVTGSPAMVTDREPWSERTAAWLASVVAARVPVLGICYGHQLLAHALGGEVARHPAGLEIGTVAVQRLAGAEGDTLLGHLPARFGAQVVHEQTVQRLPPGAVALAANAHEPHHAFRVGPCAWGVQFHPEFSDAVMRDYVACFAPALQRAGMDVAALEQGVQATPESASLLARFAQLAAAAAT